MPSPLVSVISVNYNQAALTCAMVASLRQITYPALEIIIVDNASPSDDPELITEFFPEVKLIRSEINLGFAGGNNLGIKQAKGKYLLFLNNDTEVASDFLEPLVELFERNSRAGVASPKIIFHGSDNIIQYAGSKGINPWTGRSKGIGSREKDIGQYNASAQTALADGAAMMVPRRVIDHVGLMPEMYFLYYEELDWCEKIKRAGYTCHYIANSTIFHKESMSVGKASVLKTYYMNRNRLLFIRRNVKGWPRWSSTLIFLMAAVPKKVVLYSFKLQGKHLAAIWRGLWWNFMHLNRTKTN